jgi:hypothetical protein
MQRGFSRGLVEHRRVGCTMPSRYPTTTGLSSTHPASILAGRTANRMKGVHVSLDVTVPSKFKQSEIH